jgi:hypothetical protein
MSDKIRTLIVTSNGVGWRAVLGDTLTRGLLRVRANFSDLAPSLRNELTRKALQSRYDSLSYVYDWLDAFQHHPDLDIKVVNLANLVDVYQQRNALKDADLVVLLHSAIGDSTSIISRLVSPLQGRRGKLISFIGNEYLQLPQKIRFLQAVEADFICSQLPEPSARRLYAACKKSRLVITPHGLNQRLYKPGPPSRPTDIGFCGPYYPLFIGDTERNDFIRYFEANLNRYGLTGDFRRKNMGRAEWTRFLQNSKGTIGAESGSYYLNADGSAIMSARQYLAENPNASMPDLYQRIFAPLTDYFSGKCVSSRHFEAIGTATCQLLLEGEYNGLLQPEVHYIGVNKDLSNLDEAVRRFKDDDYRQRIADAAYQHALEHHTYDHRVRSLLECVG